MRRKWVFAVVAIVLLAACVMLIRSPDLPKHLRFLEGSKQTPTFSNSKRIHEVPLSDSLTIHEVRDELQQAGGHKGKAAGLEVWNFGDCNVFLIPGRSLMTKIPGGRRQTF